MSDDFNEKYSEIINSVKASKNTDLRQFIRDDLEGCIFRDMFNEEGESFTEFYYNHANDDNEPCYPYDIDEHALEYFGEERYNSEEFQDEAYLFVPFDEKYYNDMCKYIEENYELFKRIEK